MANIKSAKKRARQSVKRRDSNQAAKNQVRTAVKKALDNPKASLSSAVGAIAKAAKRGVFHKKTASRRISRLMKKASLKQTQA